MQKDLRTIFSSCLFFLGFIWLHTFIRLNSYIDDSGTWNYIFKALISVVATVFYYWCFIGIIDPFESLSKLNTKKCAVATGVVCLVLTILLILELSSSIISVIGEQDIRIGALSLSKKYIFDICAAVLFPIVTEYVLKSLDNEHFSRESIVCAISSILLASLFGYLLFFAMCNIWLVDMAVVNFITISIGIAKYVLPKKKKKKGNIVGLLILYVLFYLFLFFVLGHGVSFSEFMYGISWKEYRDGVWFLVRNASLFGTSEQLLNSAYIHEWLVNRNNYIQQLLFYGGWAAVIGLIAFMIIFLRLLVRLLGLKNFNIHKHQLVYTAAFSILTIRITMGVIYGFALIPYPVSLPFGGSYSIITDSIVFALILYGAWENYRYERLITYELVEPDVFLTKESSYKIFVKDKEYCEEGLFDQVLIQDSDGGIICDVEWTYGNEKEIGVFIPIENLKHQVFLLEHKGEGAWCPVTDKGLYPSVMKEFFSYRIPDCMEVDRENDEED